jgi:hypothetical protein
MEEPIVKKRVDESWKEQAEREKQAPGPSPQLGSAPAAAAASAPPRSEVRSAEAPAATPAAAEAAPEAPAGAPEARFDVFVSGLAMEALIALGDMAHPVTRKPHVNVPHAKYLIDVLGILQEKTQGNLSVDEQRLLSDALYQLRMRYLAKSGGAPA